MSAESHIPDFTPTKFSIREAFELQEGTLLIDEDGDLCVMGNKEMLSVSECGSVRTWVHPDESPGEEIYFTRAPTGSSITFTQDR